MILALKSKDCPDANGRQPKSGEQKWKFVIPLDNGDILHLEIGRLGYDALTDMLRQEGLDDAKDTSLPEKLR